MKREYIKLTQAAAFICDGKRIGLLNESIRTQEFEGSCLKAPLMDEFLKLRVSISTESSIVRSIQAGFQTKSTCHWNSTSTNLSSISAKVLGSVNDDILESSRELGRLDRSSNKLRIRSLSSSKNEYLDFLSDDMITNLFKGAPSSFSAGKNCLKGVFKVKDEKLVFLSSEYTFILELPLDHSFDTFTQAFLKRNSGVRLLVVNIESRRVSNLSFAFDHQPVLNPDDVHLQESTCSLSANDVSLLKNTLTSLGKTSPFLNKEKSHRMASIESRIEKVDDAVETRMHETSLATNVLNFTLKSLICFSKILKDTALFVSQARPDGIINVESCLHTDSTSFDVYLSNIDCISY